MISDCNAWFLFKYKLSQIELILESAQTDAEKTELTTLKTDLEQLIALSKGKTIDKYKKDRWYESLFLKDSLLELKKKKLLDDVDLMYKSSDIPQMSNNPPKEIDLDSFIGNWQEPLVSNTSPSTTWYLLLCSE